MINSHVWTGFAGFIGNGIKLSANHWQIRNRHRAVEALPARDKVEVDREDKAEARGEYFCVE